MSVYFSRLQALRQVMQRAGVDAYVVLSSDPHLSEYLPDHYQGRAWLSGFKGSAGSILVTAEFAGVWTDSRYWVQAAEDLQGSGFELMRWGDPETPDMMEWIAQHLQPNQVIAYDGQVVALAQSRAWQELALTHQFTLDQSKDLLALIWPDRPLLPKAAIQIHAAPFCQRTVEENVQNVRASMQSLGASAHLLSSLDDIAWLLNLRGNDVVYNPVFMAHVLLTLDDVILFVDANKITNEVQHYLTQHQISVLPYEQLSHALAALPHSSSLLVAPHAVTVGTLAAASQVQLIETPNPSTLAKACKLPAEVQQVRQTMEADGAALCEFFAWFEQTIQQRAITELEVDEQITAARARQPHFVSPSFGTIAAFGPNGAMPHYQATAEAYATIQGDGLLLIDSGGQYLGGTTDITRVIPVGTPTSEQKRDYTLVLKGMIALSQAVFVKGLTGQQLDTVARMPLWQAGVDFGHGTGHGVGYFLNVHEGPQSISWRTRPGSQAVAMQPGMITSNEPGLYRPGQWGIRIENLIVCVEHLHNEFAEFYAFETLTLCPIDTRCIETSLLTLTELHWLNQYHQHVYERLAPRLSGSALAWLEQATQPLATTNCSN
ncbi:aminopeptidase P family protein [Paenalcaligenes hominis]|uniref:aminopeptidase P family protein n=1 Tax=Paenalcaligenes hominis TaxID=643674 RepID=UPI003525204F